MEVIQADKRYTYADYISWETKDRYELIDGVPYMQDAPARAHQAVSRELHGQIWQFLKGKPCEVYAAPFDVRLNIDGEDDTVVQPDIAVICDKSKLDDKGCDGAPDLVIEILSPATAHTDCLIKYQKYLKAGVREYWIADPGTKTVQVNVSDSGRYIGNVYGQADAVPVHILDGLSIRLSDVFGA